MNNKKNFKNQRGYIEAFIFVAIFPIIGFIIEMFSKSQGVVIPRAPVNIYILLGLFVTIIFTRLILSKNYFFKWLSTVPVSISVISYITFLVLIMALLPQNEQLATGLVKKLGLAHISRNWAMLITSSFLLYVLGLVILKRLKKFNIKDIVFLLNHLGLWIVIAAASLGSGDLIRLNMNVWENSQPEWRAKSNDNIYELPIAIKLVNFDIEEFNPEIALLDNATGKVIVDDQNKIHMIEVGKKYLLNNMKIEIEEYYELAMRVEGSYVRFPDKGAAPAVKIAVYDNENNLMRNDWISAESFMMSPQILRLNNEHSIVLLQATPKKYSSEVELFAKDGTKATAKIEVNKPYKFKGWKIYQVSYDEKMGRWSELSVLELVRDPWIPVVYFGIFMVLAGSIYLFWIGKKAKE